MKVEEITEVEGAVNDIKCVDEIEPSEEQRRKIQKGQSKLLLQYNIIS